MKPYEIHLGDCLEILKTLPDNSVDSIVTDPPYGLSKEPDMAEVLRHWLAGDDYQHKGGGFMGKSWDSFVPGPAIWRECLRVLKPGGHLLAFFGTRTQDIGTLAIRLAGFEIRDSIAWIYGGGFPKSMNLDRLKGEKICGCEGSSGAQAERDVRQVRDCNVSPAKHAGAEYGEVLHQGMQKQYAYRAVQGKEPGEGCAWCAESGLEGRRDAPEASWELRLGEVHPSAGTCTADDPQGRVHHGAPLDHGLLDRSNATSAGGSAPHRPQPTKQRPGEPGAVAGQQEPQAVGAWPVCGGCGLPRIPSGLGTALKPALEPITVARKPLAKGCTVAANVLAHGTGALNIDGCRVPAEKPTGWGGSAAGGNTWNDDNSGLCKAGEARLVNGRWPANLIHDGSDEVVALFPANAGASAPVKGTEASEVTNGIYGKFAERVPGSFFGDNGSAARFFYCAKASRNDRNEGCEHIEAAHTDEQNKLHGAIEYRNICPSCERVLKNSVRECCGVVPERIPSERATRQNNHPTVKPTDLMAYLCRLVTPPGGVVLDPFMGSGSTGKAAMREGFRFIGCELSPEYLAIAEARIEHELERLNAVPVNDNGGQMDMAEVWGAGQ